MQNDEKIFVTKASMPDYEEYIEMIKPLWDSHIITNMGKYHQKLELALRQYLCVPELSLMVNGHMALEMAIQAFDFPKGSEVITTPFTFISTTHAIIRNGLKPVFCDINPVNFTIDVDKIEELITEKTVAIVPVHVYGNVCDVEKIQEIAYKYSLKVIYDACHAFGETINGNGIGNFGDASVFSFHATKVFNTIEGGAVTFKNHEIYEKLFNLKNFGIHGEELIQDVGANAKLNEFCAIMGLCNLKKVDENISLRKCKFEIYDSFLRESYHIETPMMNELNIRHNYGYYYCIFKNNEERNTIYETLREHEIYPRKYFYPIASDAACFKQKYKDIDVNVARNISLRILVLPLYPELADEKIEQICKIILKTVKA